MDAMTGDRSLQLRQLMQQVGFSSFRALSQASGVSELQIRRLRRGDLARMPLATLFNLSQALQTSIPALLNTFANPPLNASPASPASPLQQEYDRLQTQLSQQKRVLWQEFQQSSLQVLEPLLLQLPTAAYAAQQNPQAPAVKLLPLLRPIDRLLQEWGIEAIAAVGAEIPFDPQHHQLLEGSAEPGASVRVRYTGYRQGDRLLYRARVSPVSP